MGRRSALVLVGALVFGLAACGGGGGGGDEEAFCDSLDALSGLVEDGDLADDDGLGDAVDIANDLREAASDDQEDAVQEVGQTLAEADPDDAADTAETVQDELGDFADECDIDEFAEAPEEETTTTTTEPEETTTTEPDGTTTTVIDGGGGFEGDEIVGARVPIPADLEPEFAALADTCFRGDFTSCDTLFNTTPVGSVAETYGDTCAGRIADGRGFDFECASLVATAFPPPAETTNVAAADACFNGDMNACDSLLGGAEGSADVVYGFFCGGRLNEQVVADSALCADVFGPFSEFI